MPLTIEKPATLYPRRHPFLECRKDGTRNDLGTALSHDAKQLVEPVRFRNLIVVDEREQLRPKAARAGNCGVPGEGNATARFGNVEKRQSTGRSKGFACCLRGAFGIIVRQHDGDCPRCTAAECEGVEPVKKSLESVRTTIRRDADRDRRCIVA